MLTINEILARLAQVEAEYVKAQVEGRVTEAAVRALIRASDDVDAIEEFRREGVGMVPASAEGRGAVCGASTPATKED